MLSRYSEYKLLFLTKEYVPTLVSFQLPELVSPRCPLEFKGKSSVLMKIEPVPFGKVGSLCASYAYPNVTLSIGVVSAHATPVAIGIMVSTMHSASAMLKIFFFMCFIPFLSFYFSLLFFRIILLYLLEYVQYLELSLGHFDSLMEETLVALATQSFHVTDAAP